MANARATANARGELTKAVRRSAERTGMATTGARPIKRKSRNVTSKLKTAPKRAAKDSRAHDRADRAEATPKKGGPGRRRSTPKKGTKHGARATAG